MEGHESTRKSLPIWKFIENYVIKPLMSVDSMKDLGIDEQFIQKVCGILDVNTFELRITNVSKAFTYYKIYFIEALIVIRFKA